MLCLTVAAVAVSLAFTTIRLPWYEKIINVTSASDIDEFLPYKHSVHYSVPQTFQENRGTCWSHALMGPLEHSYRLNGLKKGYLRDNEYVRFSIQAFSISIIKECQKPENYKICKELQAGPELNTTAGGEPAWVHYLTSLQTQLFPDSICPYLPEDEDEFTCPPLDKELKATTNPILYNITNMATAYDNVDAKRLLVKSGTTLAFSTNVHNNIYHIPCPADTATEDPKYSTLCPVMSKSRVPCPAHVMKIAETDLCLPLDQPGYNMDGEWFLLPNTVYVPQGGHAMQMVAYNDEFVARNGEEGGWAIKNSWRDVAYPWDPSHGFSRGGRGSHSIGYWMSNISIWDERMICPNAHNPTNWISCTSIRRVPKTEEERRMEEEMEANPETATVHNRSPGEYAWRKSNGRVKVAGLNVSMESDVPNDHPVKHCLDDAFSDELVGMMRQPTEFSCVNDSKVKCDANNTRYFLDSLVEDENYLVTAKFIAVPRNDTSLFSTFVINQVPYTIIAEAMQPIPSQAERMKNDPDQCGYYWWPYSLADTSTARSESWNANLFQVSWADSSYLANSKKGYNRNFNYEYLKTSVFTQNHTTFYGNLPHAKRTPL